MKKALKSRLVRNIIIALVAIVELLFSISAEPQARVAVPGNHVLASVQSWEPAAAELELHMMVVLGLRNSGQLEELKAQLQQPGSPSYHHWLSSGEFAREFGPTAAQMQAVTDWLRGSGFTIDSTDLGTREVRFSGSVAQVQQALGIVIVSKGSQFANLTDPYIPASLAGSIAAFFGLEQSKSQSSAAAQVGRGSRGDFATGSSSRQQALLAAGFLALLQRGPSYQSGRQRRHHGPRLYCAAGGRHLTVCSVTFLFANAVRARCFH